MWAGGNSPRGSTKATTWFMGFWLSGWRLEPRMLVGREGVSVTNQFGVLLFGNCSWHLGHVFGRVLFGQGEGGCATRVTLLVVLLSGPGCRTRGGSCHREGDEMAFSFCCVGHTDQWQCPCVCVGFDQLRVGRANERVESMVRECPPRFESLLRAIASEEVVGPGSYCLLKLTLVIAFGWKLRYCVCWDQRGGSHAR